MKPAVVASALLAGGCADTSLSTLKAPSDVPAIAIDQAASEVVSENTSDANELAPVVTKAIEASLGGRTNEALPARYRGRIQGSDEVNGTAIATCAVPLSLPLVTISFVQFCALKRFKARVDLVLETGAGVFRGKGEASRSTSPRDDATLNEVWQAAIYGAVQEALAHATKEHQRVASVRRTP